MNTTFMHTTQDTHTTGAELYWYRLPLLRLFSACEYFSFTISTALNLHNFQHMHTAFSVPAASQNTLNRFNKNTFMPMLASFERAEIVQLHPTDLLLLCVCKSQFKCLCSALPTSRLYPHTLLLSSPLPSILGNN